MKLLAVLLLAAVGAVGQTQTFLHNLGLVSHAHWQGNFYLNTSGRELGHIRREESGWWQVVDHNSYYMEGASREEARLQLAILVVRLAHRHEDCSNGCGQNIIMDAFNKTLLPAVVYSSTSGDGTVHYLPACEKGAKEPHNCEINGQCHDGDTPQNSACIDWHGTKKSEHTATSSAPAKEQTCCVINDPHVYKTAATWQGDGFAESAKRPLVSEAITKKETGLVFQDGCPPPKGMEFRKNHPCATEPPKTTWTCKDDSAVLFESVNGKHICVRF